MQQAEENKSVNRIGLVFLLLGRLFTTIVCGMIAGGIFLDMFGTETTGELTNIAYDAKRSDNPFTPQITFSTADGKEVSFIAWQGQFPFEIDNFVQFASAENPDYSNVKVRYLESNPKIAKVSLPYHAEYLNRAVWLFWSFVALMIGVISRRNKPVVLDFSQRKK
ncbi:MAG: hypothetical protein OHK003_31530 [Anaerolineales bacterium]